MFNLNDIDPNRPVLIYGPTASGKSAMAMAIAQAQGGVIVNADALQCYQGWEVLSAQPNAQEQADAPHALYGHLPSDTPYSAGDWLRDVTPYLAGKRPIIVGGTGLNFLALTQGLADIPATPPEVRALGNTLELQELLTKIDPDTQAGLDLKNRARVQRAWEVQTTTGRSIRAWQAETPPPLLPLSRAHSFVLMPQVEWLNARIERRFDLMLEAGALDEARKMEPDFDPAAPSSKTIGAKEMVAVVRGQLPQSEAAQAIIIASRQYAKRQRTWARARMRAWETIELS